MLCAESDSATHIDTDAKMYFALFCNKSASNASNIALAEFLWIHNRARLFYEFFIRNNHVFSV